MTPPLSHWEMFDALMTEHRRPQPTRKEPPVEIDTEIASWLDTVKQEKADLTAKLAAAERDLASLDDALAQATQKVTTAREKLTTMEAAHDAALLAREQGRAAVAVVLAALDAHDAKYAALAALKASL